MAARFLVGDELEKVITFNGFNHEIKYSRLYTLINSITIITHVITLIGGVVK